LRYRPSEVATYPSFGCSWDASRMTLLWFLIWFVSNLIGDKEPLTFNPVNWWAGFLLLAIALDLNKSYVIKHG
jgi:hypothetical protein